MVNSTAWFSISLIFLMITSCSSKSSSTSDYQGSPSTTFSEPKTSPAVSQAQPRSGSNYAIGTSITYDGKTYKIVRAHCPGVGNEIGCKDFQYDLVDDAGNVANNVTLP
jgi:hypothetical protein